MVVFTGMFEKNHPQKLPLFAYFAPLGASFKGILSIPHSGETIPFIFEEYLTGNIKAFKEDVDYKVDELVDIDALQKAGIAVLVSHIHRICVDLNRNEENSVLFWKQNTQGEKLVIKDPSPLVTEMMIETYHRPYFELLKSIIKDLETKKRGPVSVIDLHSMPSRPTDYHMKQNPNQKLHRSSFCLSDRRGKTCSLDFIHFFRDELNLCGYETAINDPYVGGFITEFVDKFRTNNIQIEINRSVYMDESTKELIDPLVNNLKPLLTNILIKGFEKFDS
jgi:N-formylglutamate amidohydrolase